MKKRNRKLSNGWNRQPKFSAAGCSVRATESAVVERESAEAKVEASGTSEGAKKGWESRLRENVGKAAESRKQTQMALARGEGWESARWHAQDASKAAFEASEIATSPARAKNKDAHSLAAEAHRSAAQAHHDISASAGQGPSHSGMHHDRIANNHQSWAMEAEANGSKTKSSDTEEQTMTIQAKATVHCKASGSPILAKKTWEVDKPIDFMWMPGGVTTIHASYGRTEQDQRPIELTVMASKDCAQAVQSAFEAIRASNPRRPPFICVEHRAQERAGEPVLFEWRDEPEPAIYCRCLPSELGAKNVNGKIHTSFSPTFDTDAEYHKMQCVECEKTPAVCACEGKGWYFPDGVKGSASNPAKVTAPDVQSVGSLTNWNAFRNILPIAARESREAKVEASGTSEGARKGAQTKKYGYSHWNDRISVLNKTLERHSGDGGTKAHAQLAYLHGELSDAHSEALQFGHDEGVEKSILDKHEAAMEDHSEKHEHHLAAANYKEKRVKLSATSTETQTETVKAEESEPLTVETILARKVPMSQEADAVLARLTRESLGLGKVEAAGTSEGVRKSWEKRHALNQNEADEASHDAHEYGERAGRYANYQTLHLASQRHSEASLAHRRAKKTALEGGDTEGADHHEKLANEHRSLADALSKRIPNSYFRSNYRASDTETQTETVKAAGTSEGVRKSWEKRTREAHSMTSVVDRADCNLPHGASSSQLRELAKLHDEARVAHNSAAYNVENAEDISDAQADIIGHRHTQLSAHHGKSARRLRELAERKDAQIKSSDTETQTETVKAKGTSEGAYKAWEKRARKTQEAVSLSEKAHNVMTHQAAMRAHYDAYQTGVQDPEIRKLHSEMTEHHREQIKKLNSTKSTSTETQTETVKAKENEPLTVETILARVGQTGRPPAKTDEGQNS